MKEVNAPNCGRENDLIAFLYGELNDKEARSFQSHVHSCGACGAELGNLQNVRESVVAWRNESLGGVVSPAQIASVSPARLDQEKPSALAALREFFKLAPLWMKGAVAFASILFCLFAGLALARLRATPPPVIVATPNVNATSEQQLNALVERRVQEELEKIKTASEAPPTAVAGSKPADRNSGRGPNRTTVASNDPIQKARRPLSKNEREQLAADLRLVSAKNENDIDLLDDGINQ